MLNIVKNALSFLLYMIPGFFGIGFIILVHETGHFFMAKFLRVDVEEFGIGIGPKIYTHEGINTRFVLSLIPFGGHCTLSGSEDLAVALNNKDKNIDSAEEGSFFAVKPFKKFFIYLSGPVINFIFGVFLLFLTYSIPTEHLSNKAYVTPISSYSSLFDNNIEQSELKKGDLIISLNGKTVNDYEECERILSFGNGKNVNATVLRNDKIENITLRATKIDDKYSYGITLLEKCIIGHSESELFQPLDEIISVNGVNTPYTLDFYSIDSPMFNIILKRNNEYISVEIESSKTFPFSWYSDTVIRSDSPTPLTDAFSKCISFSLTISKAIGKLLSFRLSDALKEISGPFTSASRIGKISTLAFKSSFSSGFRSVCYLLSIVSLSICIGNLIPIPTFDGGGMLVSVFEMIKRKPLKPKSYVILHISGVVIAWIIIIIMNAWPIIRKIFKF